MLLSRRKLITGLISLAAAPAIVRVESLMPVKVIKETPQEIMIKFLNSLPTYEGSIEPFAANISWGLHDGINIKWISYEEALEHWPVME